MTAKKQFENTITWFDIPVTDIQRARIFYETILDTELQMITFPNGLKIAIFPSAENSVTGALAEHKDHYFPSVSGSLVYLNGDPDLQVILDRVKKAGGEILLPKSLISEHWGFMALLLDSEGNRVALHSKK